MAQSTYFACSKPLKVCYYSRNHTVVNRKPHNWCGLADHTVKVNLPWYILGVCPVISLSTRWHLAQICHSQLPLPHTSNHLFSHSIYYIVSYLDLFPPNGQQAADFNDPLPFDTYIPHLYLVFTSPSPSFIHVSWIMKMVDEMPPRRKYHQQTWGCICQKDMNMNNIHG